MSEPRTFRIRVEFEDGNIADFDVTSVNLYAWQDAPLEIDSEAGLTIRSPRPERNTKTEPDA